ncbi:hypothetical protein [Flammeovirga sp. SubArs3]|uniref:hypothetical protein n=1 Tax=Flammeovirga sp. SubArs3 TaxID=2995316 RepID=UPI00248AABD8|nr:hypothetical protein [Flammeovirga sp. SubArs3]
MSDQENQGFFSKFVNNIEDYINNLVTLDIKTVIGEYRVEGEKDEIIKKENTDFKLMNSQIHLLKGDITTHISNDLLQDKYAWVRDFHAQKEQHGHQIINDNIKAIFSLYELYQKTKGVDVPEVDFSRQNPAQVYGNTAAAQPATYAEIPMQFDPTATAAAAPAIESPNSMYDYDQPAAMDQVAAEMPAEDVEAEAIDFDAPADDFNSVASEDEENKEEKE